MRTVITNILLSLATLLACLLLGETLLRSLYRYSPNYDYEMWRYGAEIKQALPSATLPFHHAPNRKGTYYGAEISTNSLGFRDNEYSLVKPPGRQRALLLGDSFALGWGVPFDQTSAKQLERMLNSPGNGVEVINMGIGNYNSSMEAELFKDMGLKLMPDIVILMYFVNDMEPTPNVSPFWHGILSRSYLIAYLGERIGFLLKHHHEGLTHYYRRLYSPENPAFALNTGAIRELMRSCRARGIRVLVVNIPDLRQLHEYPFSFATDHIRMLAEEAHVPFLDLLPEFAGQDNASLWVSPADPHMNVKANTIAANAIYRKLLAEGMAR